MPVFRENYVKLDEFLLPHAFSLYRAGNMAERFERTDVQTVWQRKKTILNAVGGYPPDKCVGMIALHGSKILKIERDQLGGFLKCDCLVTFIPGTALTLAQADCFPIILTNCSKSFAVLIHAGWRGLDLGIVGECVRFLERKNVHPFEVIAAVGPGIQKCCYKNHENHELLKKESWKPFISYDTSGASINLLAKAKSDLVDAGVPKDNILVADFCTCCREENDGSKEPLFFSHRRKKDEGRFLTVVGLERKKTA